ncbi:MAG TPA: aminotransferase class III-fold pyridoxal phosphate-dependent enzyme [Thermomicrobiales bacterium]|nr:aminotransferase class III-fold pyridoxal phosphate-dependent enzyme [Thermomicrobiales bacterium]
MAQAPARTTIGQDFAERFAGSRAMHERARQVIPSGITHDGRNMKPFPPSIVRAAGARKWDVDGHELLDYCAGHGSLILGHVDPDVTAAAAAALQQGTHFSAGHEGEIRWAELVRQLVPSAEKVRFTGSGTESTLLAVRIARSYAGKPTILKFEGHFHGWQDYLLKGERPPFEATSSPGILESVMDTVAVVPNNDLDAVEARLQRGDVAAIILEPSGGAWSTIPLVDGFLAGLRDVATRYDTVLIFDEVITGFRWAPGGAQERYGVIPDMTTMAKIVAGGLPGGAVAGRADVMSALEFKDEPGWNATKKVRHQGTYNSSPVVAAAAIACLTKVADRAAVHDYCDALATRLRSGFNTALVERDLPGFAWGESSVFHVALGSTAANRTAGDLRLPEGPSAVELKQSGGHPRNAQLQIGMLLEGVDLFHSGGFTTVAHTEADIDQTVAAFGRVLDRMTEEGAFA